MSNASSGLCIILLYYIILVIVIPWLQGFIVENHPEPEGAAQAWFSNDKSIATMVYLLYILPHWSVRHTSSIDTVFNLATTYGNGLPLF